jgi:hypothetical protein
VDNATKRAWSRCWVRAGRVVSVRWAAHHGECYVPKEGGMIYVFSNPIKWSRTRGAGVKPAWAAAKARISSHK